MDTSTRVLVCYNAPVSLYQNYSGKPKPHTEFIDDMSETSFEADITNFVASVRENFALVGTAAIGRDVYQTIAVIREHNPGVIFNLVESVEGVAAYESYQAGLYELLRVPYTGNTPDCLGNCLNKFRTKQLLASHHISVPGAIVWSPKKNLTESNFSLRFPVITKLLKEDASIGISENSVVDSFDALIKQLHYLDGHFHQHVLIEEYIEGREFNCAILGGEPLPLSEISFEGLPAAFPKIVTYEGKWMEESVYYKHTVPVCPAEIDEELAAKIRQTAVTAFGAMNCRDYARVDVRLSADNTPYVIEVNPNPDISSGAGLARAARIGGYPYPELLKKIIGFAKNRAANN